MPPFPRADLGQRLRGLLENIRRRRQERQSCWIIYLRVLAAIFLDRRTPARLPARVRGFLNLEPSAASTDGVLHAILDPIPIVSLHRVRARVISLRIDRAWKGGYLAWACAKRVFNRR